MPDEQNPSLPDLMLPEYAPDPELLAREKAIYDRIMKSPSERAKERTAEMWNERYGVKPESGKLRRILAGIGEVARGIGAGAKYQSIPDMAREEALKEYQAEVPNLNRELATISGQKNAAMSAMQKQNAASLKYAVDSYRAAMAGIKSQAEADSINARTPEQVKLLARQADAAEAQANLTNTKAYNETVTGGRAGLVGDIAWLQSQNPEQMAKILEMRNAVSRQDALSKLLGNPRVYQPSGFGGGTKVTTREVLAPTGNLGPDGSAEMKVREFKTTTTGGGSGAGGFDLASVPNTIQKLQEAFKNAGVSQTASSAVEKALAPPPPGPPQVEFNDPASGTTYKAVTPAKPQKVTATVQNGRTVAMPKVDPKLIQTIKVALPSIDLDNPETLAPFAGAEFHIKPRKMTSQEESEHKYRLEGIRLAKLGIEEFLSGDLDLSVGIPGRLIHQLEKLVRKPSSGKIATETTALRNLGEYLRAISGLATTVPETSRAKQIMPTTNDQPETLLIKAFQAAMIEAQHGWMKSLNIPLEAKAKIFQENPELLTAPKTTVDVVMQHLSAAAAARKNKQATYKLPGGIETYNTNGANQLSWELLTNVAEEMEDAFYKSFPEGYGIAPPAKYRKKRNK